MQVQFKKNAARPHIIKYVRDNGTETWTYSDEFFVRHDLSHYALEKTLGYKTAFNGMINNGMDIQDFGNKEKRALLSVTDEACYAENMANLFLMEIAQGEFEDFNTVQQQAFMSFNKQYPIITLSSQQVNAVRSCLRGLLQQWKSLPSGETLELTFSV